MLQADGPDANLTCRAVTCTVRCTLGRAGYDGGQTAVG